VKLLLCLANTRISSSGPDLIKVKTHPGSEERKKNRTDYLLAACPQQLCVFLTKNPEWLVLKLISE
jgi:hypothetical protein